ncbi:DUF2267 domain-containing protein [Haloplanus rubicundus]|uniref:DUF2267 domain-containing protein n=1 Tax=Haloplanus rubicundus TaxID=1547898 RepID=A0A345EC66_9EURY|nr:DUF2267 domain-containing protein [Haloplanus rubicundus]AXG09788.1 DUF2267 domain-containing protein [Haloplanus rubicundus]
MTTAAIVDGLRERTDIETEERALEVIEATLRTLAERISHEEGLDIADFLPAALQTWSVDPESWSEGSFSFDEFLSRVAERAGLDSKNQALTYAQAVFEALRVDVTEPELDRMQTQLPASYDTLFS